MIRRSSEPRKKNTALNEDREFFSSPIHHPCTPRLWTLDHVEYLPIIQLIDCYKQLMHRLGVVADDDNNNKTQTGQFSEIGKLQYLRSR